jgi:hypothetical protein
MNVESMSELDLLLELKENCKIKVLPLDFWDFWFSYFNSKPEYRKIYKSSLLKYNFYAKLLLEIIQSKNCILKIE